MITSLWVQGALKWVALCVSKLAALMRPFAGAFATVEEIADAEKINASNVGRILRLTLLAPDIVDAILDGRQPAEMTLAVLMRPFAVGWAEQFRCLEDR